MNPNEPRNPDQHPDNADTTRLPDTPPHTQRDHQHTVPLEGNASTIPPGGQLQPADQPAGNGPDPDRAERRRKMRPLLIGAGAAAAILLLGGGGIAIGAAIADNDDDDRVSLTNSESSSPGVQSDDESAQSGSDDDGGDNGDDKGSSGSSGGSDSGTAAPAEAGDLTDAIEAAVAEANGEGATAIEVERDGYDVDVQLADGTEQEVRVALDGSATVRDGDSDRDDDPILDTAKIPDIIDAALAEAGDGTIESISTDNGPAAYEVSVDMGNGDDTDVDLDASLKVLSVDHD